MPGFFERMMMLSRANPDSVPEFLRTHPVTANRLSDSQSRAEQYPRDGYREDSWNSASSRPGSTPARIPPRPSPNTPAVVTGTTR